MADESLTFLIDLMADERIESLSDHFVVGDLLGCGRFSQVRRAKRSVVPKGGSAEVALKGFALSELDDEEALEMLEAEVNALRRAGKCEELRPYVVGLDAVLRTADSLFLVMNIVSGSELFVLVERHNGLPEPMSRTLMAQLMLALSKLDEVGVAHRDIKPENLMVSGLHSAATASLVLIDFGFAAVSVEAAAEPAAAPAPAGPTASAAQADAALIDFGDDTPSAAVAVPPVDPPSGLLIDLGSDLMGGTTAAATPATISATAPPANPPSEAPTTSPAAAVPRQLTEPTMKGLAGTPGYAAPEVLRWLEDEDDAPPYSCACDVWSCGVTAHVLLAAQMPLDAECSVDQLMTDRPRFAHPVWHADNGAAARDFVSACMCPRPDERPTAAALLQHPWIADLASAAAAWPAVWPPETGFAAFASRMRRATAFAAKEAKEGGGRLQRGAKTTRELLVQRPGAALASIRSSTSSGRARLGAIAMPPAAAPVAAASAGGTARSTAAEEGIAMLKRGARAKLYQAGRGGGGGKSGRIGGGGGGGGGGSGSGALACVFRLSADERSLAWDAQGLSMLRRGSTSRSIPLSDIVDLTVGAPEPLAAPKVYEADAPLPLPDEQRLSLSLLLLPALPAPPSDDRAEDLESAAAGAAREMLHIAVQDEEQFGLWLAALRELIHPLPPNDLRRRLIRVAPPRTAELTGRLAGPL